MNASNPFARWWKFNLVGAIGMAVQLSALAILNHAWRTHYLLTSTAAIELAVLHNFIWHVRYTWPDRHTQLSWPAQLLRFHLSNGVSSVTGNMLLMRACVHRLHIAVLPANAITIACCSVLNFALSDRWAFSRNHAGETYTAH